VNITRRFNKAYMISTYQKQNKTKAKIPSPYRFKGMGILINELKQKRKL
jgi:hypothetical protein